MKFYGMVGHNTGTNQLDFEWPWPKVKATRGQKVKIVLRTAQFRIVVENREKLKYSLFNSLNNSKYDLDW